MRQFLLGLSFSVVFMVGCAVGTMQGSQVAEAQAPEAQASARVTRWEIKCEPTKNKPTKEAYRESVEAIGNELGADGWEPAGEAQVGGFWCFKRPLP